MPKRIMFEVRLYFILNQRSRHMLSIDDIACPGLSWKKQKPFVESGKLDQQPQIQWSRMRVHLSLHVYVYGYIYIPTTHNFFVTGTDSDKKD